MRSLPLLLVAVGASCGKPSEPPPSAPRPHLEVAPPALAFGRVTSMQKRVVTVRNLGHVDSVLTVQPPQLQSPDFTLAVRGSLELAAGAPPLELDVTVMPSSPGWKTAELELASNDPEQPLLRLPITASAVDADGCEVQVSPPRLDFGVLTEPTELAVSVTSSGAGVCVLTDVGLEVGSAAAFSLPTGQVPLELLPGESKPLRVRAAPSLVTMVGRLVGILRVGTHQVALAATLAPTCLAVTPSDLDFGTLSAGCASAVRHFAIYNVCAVPVELSSVRKLGDEFHIESSPGFPSMLMPGSTPASLRIRYRPVDLGPDTGSATLGVTQVGVPVDYAITLRGTGDNFTSNTDTFAIPPRPKLDLLFIVDDSASMASHRASVIANVGRAVSRLELSGLDLQLAVTTSGGSGALVADAGSPAIVTDATSALDMLIADKVASVGTSGSDTTQLLASAVAAVTGNSGFARAGAQLTVVTLSDNDDRSPQPVTTYVNPLQFVCPTASLVAIGPALAMAPAGCSYDTTGGQPRTRAAVTALNGIEEDICSPTWDSLFQPTTYWGPQSTFYLTAEPVAATLAVTVDGAAPPPSAWMYDGLRAAVVFGPLWLPPPGSMVRVTYRVACF